MSYSPAPASAPGKLIASRKVFQQREKESFSLQNGKHGDRREKGK